MAKYLIHTKRWVPDPRYGGRLVYPGMTIEYGGRPGKGMEPIDEEAKAAVKEEEERKMRLIEARTKSDLAAAALALAQQDLDSIRRETVANPYSDDNGPFEPNRRAGPRRTPQVVQQEK